MKRLFGISLSACIFLMLLSSCEVYIEGRYHWHDSILGYYTMEEYSNTYNDFSTYTIYIGDGEESGSIWIENFYGVGVDVYAYLDYDRLVIPNQSVGGYEIEGVGTIYAHQIDLTYSVKNWRHTGPTDFCESTAFD